MTGTASALPIAATGVETTGTNPTYHMAWEVGVIRRDLDGTETRHLWQIRPTSVDLMNADDEALDISRFRDRMVVPHDEDALDMTPTLTGGQPIPLSYVDAAWQIHDTLQRTVMVGSNPHFDASFLHHLFRAGKDPWHYRPVCAVTLAAARLRAQGAMWQMPFSTDDVANTIGVPRPGPDKAHTALGDAEWALALYDAATAYPPALRRCLFPGCLHEFDVIAHMSGWPPATSAWSGKGWVQMRPTILTGYACPDHAQAIRDHRITWQHPADGTLALACSCGWASPTARWRGVPEAAWQEHLLLMVGASE
ncbi:3'-5' exonuclease [Actinacidiphila acididurans]|uniref:DNA polymerase III subunit epsilon n=1 Tax=Actinacidiphila acididurans TaxID=2784346 RepID=A0ABS2U6Z9_9ACTN|nr:hypothetical protein [Actinacidiphila acididurans]MBM9509933.1 hypothetical protein [Actinacidiphila acididurans]